jgi:TP901 family phage tail tape measure protein
VATATELDRMVVRLVGDAASYDAMIKKASRDTESFAARVQKAGQSMTASVTAPAAAVGGLGTGAFASFDQAMTEAFAKMGRQAPEVTRQMEDVAKALSTSGEVAFGPAELAKGYEELASAGLNAERSMAALPLVAKFAQAGAFNLGVAVKQLTGAMASFGITTQTSTPEQFAREMSHFSDVIVGVANETTTGVEQVARAMSADAAVAAKNYGMSLEQLGAVLGVYAMQNKDAEEAGNLTGRMLRLLTASAVKEADAWARLGVSITDAKGNFKDFPDAMAAVEKALGGAKSDVERIQMLSDLGFKTLAQKSILPLIGASEELKRQEALYKKIGTTAEMASIQMQSFSNQAKVIINSAIVASIELGKRLAPAFLAVGAVVKSAVGWWRALSEQTQRTVLLTAAVLAAVGPLLVAFGLLRHALTGLIFAKLIGEVAGYVMYLQTRTDLVMKGWELLKAAAAVTWGVIKTVIVVTAEAAKEFAAVVVDALSGANETFNEFVNSAVGWAKEFVDANRDSLVVFGGWAITAALVAGAVKLAVVAFGFLSGVLAALKIQQVVGAAFWAAYALVVATVKIATWALSAALGAAGLVVSGLALGVVGLIAGLALLGGGLLVAGSAVAGAVTAGNELFRTLAGFKGMDGVLGPIGAMFKEWGGILKDVFKTAQTDSKMAWQLLKAGLALAVEQVKALLPPLWAFVSGGFQVVWDLVADQFFLAFDRAMARAIRRTLDFFRVFGMATPAVTAAAEALLEGAVGDTPEKLTADAKAKLEGLSAAFAEAMARTNPAVENARSNVKGIGQMIEHVRQQNQAKEFWPLDMFVGPPGKDEPFWPKDMLVGPPAGLAGAPGAAERAKAAVEGVGAGAKKAADEIKNLNAVLYGSAEALAQVAEFRQKFANRADLIGPAAKEAAEAGKAAVKTADPLGSLAANLEKDPSKIWDQTGWQVGGVMQDFAAVQERGFADFEAAQKEGVAGYAESKDGQIDILKEIRDAIRESEGGVAMLDDADLEG